MNIKKTEVLYQPNSTRTRNEDITVDGNKLKSVLEFIYLGSTISSNGCIGVEIQTRMANVSASFRRLRQTLCNNHHVSLRVKARFTVQLCCPSSCMEPRQVKKLHAFMTRHLRSIMTKTLMGKVSNKELLERTELPCMEDLLIRTNLRWTEDVTRQATKAGSLL